MRSHSYSGAVGSPSLNESWRAVLSPSLSKRPTVAVEFERNAVWPTVAVEWRWHSKGDAFDRRWRSSDGGTQKAGGFSSLPSGDAREGSDTPGRREPKECERGRAEVLGTFSARAHRECKVQCGVCDCGRHALRAGRQLASAYRDVSQRPTHKMDTTRDSCCTLHLHHILCSAHTYTRATARRDSSDSLRTARHVQAQRESRVTTQHLRSCLCQNKSTSSPTYLPGALTA